MTASSFTAIVRTTTGALLIYLAISAVLVQNLRQFFHEGHGVEEASLGLLLLAVALWVMLAGRLRWREWQIPAALILMMARELDFDKRFTEHGLLKLTTYTHEAPLATKIVGGAAILFTLWVGVRILRRNLPVWWSRLRQGTADAWMLGAAFLCGVFAKSFDGLARKLLPLGVHVPEYLNSLAGQTEEVLEMVCYYLIVLSIARLAVPSIRQVAGLEPIANGQPDPLRR